MFSSELNVTTDFDKNSLGTLLKNIARFCQICHFISKHIFAFHQNFINTRYTRDEKLSGVKWLLIFNY